MLEVRTAEEWVRTSRYRQDIVDIRAEQGSDECFLSVICEGRVGVPFDPHEGDTCDILDSDTDDIAGAEISYWTCFPGNERAPHHVKDSSCRQVLGGRRTFISNIYREGMHSRPKLE